MFDRSGLRTSAVVPSLMAVASAWVWARLPEGAQVPIHFNAAGEADRWTSAHWGLLFLPLLSVLMVGLQQLLPHIDPRGDKLRASLPAYRQLWLAVQGVLLVAHAAILGHALGWPLPVAQLMPAVVGLMIMVMGNLMGKLRWNYSVGIRTPWTLADERVWDQTHRFGGRLFVLAGLMILLGAAVPALQPWQGKWIALVSLAAASLAVLKSYLLWRRNMPR